MFYELKSDNNHTKDIGLTQSDNSIALNNFP